MYSKQQAADSSVSVNVSPFRGHRQHFAIQVHCQTPLPCILDCDSVAPVTRSRMQRTLQSQHLAATYPSWHERCFLVTAKDQRTGSGHRHADWSVTY